MRPAFQFAVWFALGGALGARAQERPVIVPEILPTAKTKVIVDGLSAKSPDVLDLTPVELMHEPAHAPHAEPPSGGWYAGAEFLYVTPRQKGLDFAIVDPTNNIAPTGRVQSLHYDGAPAVRATLAYQVPGHNWDFGVTYTYLRATDHFSTTAGPAGLLYPTLTKTGLTNEAQSASADARLTLNIYDIELGRRWEVDSTLKFRLLTGVRIMTARQAFEATYFGRDADTASAGLKSNFDGVGPFAGVESWWGLTSSLGVFGRASGGLLTGAIRNPYFDTNNGGATTYADVVDRVAVTIPYATLGLGLSWEYHGLSLRAGYEVTSFFGLFERPTFVNDFAEGKYTSRGSNLGLDGFFVQLGLSF